MPAATKSPTDAQSIRHEEFCLPRPGEDKPRVEGYKQYVDDEAGRSVPAVFCTRCLECGAVSYRPISG